LVYKPKKKNKYLKVVISDVRFLHEFNFIKEKGGYIIKVVRDLENIDTHLSETELDELGSNEYNYTIYNNNSKEHLYKNIVDIFN
tara:strand:+ start:802 stop:1056 length:255 start_codon:yes stop_codon:yes gene_type:complete